MSHIALTTATGIVSIPVRQIHAICIPDSEEKHVIVYSPDGMIIGTHISPEHVLLVFQVDKPDGVLTIRNDNRGRFCFDPTRLTRIEFRTQETLLRFVGGIKAIWINSEDHDPGKQAADFNRAWGAWHSSQPPTSQELSC
jgi:hypothetical protein